MSRATLQLHVHAPQRFDRLFPCFLVADAAVNSDRIVLHLKQACHEIDFANQIILDERIGSGAFGSVYRGVVISETLSVSVSTVCFSLRCLHSLFQSSLFSLPCGIRITCQICARL